MHINDLILIDELYEVYQDGEGQKYINNGYEFITIEENTKVAIKEAIKDEKINTISEVEVFIQDYIETFRDLPHITQIDEEAIDEIVKDKLGKIRIDKEQRRFVEVEKIEYHRNKKNGNYFCRAIYMPNLKAYNGYNYYKYID